MVREAKVSEWNIQLTCCECYLTHDIDIKLEKNGDLLMILKRNDEVTEKKRHHLSRKQILKLPMKERRKILKRQAIKLIAEHPEYGKETE